MLTAVVGIPELASRPGGERIAVQQVSKPQGIDTRRRAGTAGRRYGGDRRRQADEVGTTIRSAQDRGAHRVGARRHPEQPVLVAGYGRERERVEARGDRPAGGLRAGHRVAGNGLGCRGRSRRNRAAGNGRGRSRAGRRSRRRGRAGRRGGHGTGPGRGNGGRGSRRSRAVAAVHVSATRRQESPPTAILQANKRTSCFSLLS